MAFAPKPRPWPLAPLLQLLPPVWREKGLGPDRLVRVPSDALLAEAVEARRLALGLPALTHAAVLRRVTRAAAAGGLTDAEADEWALALGLHAGLVWPGWWEAA